MSNQRIRAEDFYRLNNNTLGHPRYVIGHGWLLTPDERFHRREMISLSASIKEQSAVFDRFYKIACKRANAIGGKKFDTKSYRGGIAFVSFNLDETISYIEASLLAASAPSSNIARKRAARAKIAHEA